MTPPDPHGTLERRLDALAMVRSGSGHEVLPLTSAATHVWSYGPAGAGPTVLMLHGFRGDHHGLELPAAFLPNYRIVIPDLPGFGASEPLRTGDHSVLGYARWAREVLDVYTRAGDVVLVGHSFGSVIAAATAATAPMDAVVGVVLISPIPAPVRRVQPRSATVWADGFHRWAGRLPERLGDRLLRHPLVTRVSTTLTLTTPDPAVRRWIHREHRRHFSSFASRDMLLEAYDAAAGGSVDAYAERIDVPTRLIAGRIDRLAPIAELHRTAALFEDAELTLVDGVGHLLHYEAPERVAAVIHHAAGRAGLSATLGTAAGGAAPASGRGGAAPLSGLAPKPMSE
ncbi:alpha/beta fold hydrolase [Millisia brevis]|uniref:alpha/beta fold hydrolase n=1 Tax=Millisia brevis TaxID=264148 RepID=UPI00083140AD|nr:alpha/beta hydrolase [Millisia brevis]